MVFAALQFMKETMYINNGSVLKNHITLIMHILYLFENLLQLYWLYQEANVYRSKNIILSSENVQRGCICCILRRKPTPLLHLIIIYLLHLNSIVILALLV